MYRNKLRSSMDQVRGFSRELWGEITGNDKVFSSGLRQRMIGRLESYSDMARDDAEQQIDKLSQ